MMVRKLNLYLKGNSGINMTTSKQLEDAHNTEAAAIVTKNN
jgi:hypothetical protein